MKFSSKRIPWVFDVADGNILADSITAAVGASRVRDLQPGPGRCRRKVDKSFLKKGGKRGKGRMKATEQTIKDTTIIDVILP
jgi:hypothetical protein